MTSVKTLARKFLRDEQGLETVEYAIIAGLIVVGTIATVISIGTLVNQKFTALESALDSNTG